MEIYAQGLKSDQNSAVVLPPGQVSAAATVEAAEKGNNAGEAV